MINYQKVNIPMDVGKTTWPYYMGYVVDKNPYEWDSMWLNHMGSYTSHPPMANGSIFWKTTSPSTIDATWKLSQAFEASRFRHEWKPEVVPSWLKVLTWLDLSWLRQCWTLWSVLGWSAQSLVVNLEASLLCEASYALNQKYCYHMSRFCFPFIQKNLTSAPENEGRHGKPRLSLEKIIYKWCRKLCESMAYRGMLKKGMGRKA